MTRFCNSDFFWKFKAGISANETEVSIGSKIVVREYCTTLIAVKLSLPKSAEVSALLQFSKAVCNKNIAET